MKKRTETTKYSSKQILHHRGEDDIEKMFVLQASPPATTGEGKEPGARTRSSNLSSDFKLRIRVNGGEGEGPSNFEVGDGKRAEGGRGGRGQLRTCNLERGTSKREGRRREREGERERKMGRLRTSNFEVSNFEVANTLDLIKISCNYKK